MRGWGKCEIWENNMLILLISTKKLYFCDNDALYDVILQETVRKWCHNHRHKISRDSFSELPLFKTFSIIFIFRQIAGTILPFVALALFANPSSLNQFQPNLKWRLLSFMSFFAGGDDIEFLLKSSENFAQNHKVNYNQTYFTNSKCSWVMGLKVSCDGRNFSAHALELVGQS